jgi:outer membrane immunogenic protein
MKKFVLGSLALAGLLATPAMAADMPVKARPAPPVCYNWSGVYVGAHAGFLFGEAEWVYVNPFINNLGIATPAGHSQTVDLAHWLVGGHLGALLQFGCSPFGNFVIGVEGSLNATHRNSEDGIVDLRFGPPGAILAGATTLALADLDEYHTAGIRLGWAWDTWLFTVNGGWATANIHTRYVFDPALTPAFFDFGRDTHRHNGWYVGAAIENAVVRGPFVDFIIGLEYQFRRFEEERHCVVSTASTCPAPGVNLALTPARRLGAERDISVDAHTVRVRATIKTPGFGFFFAP